jgi:protein SCO1/2
MLKEALVTFLAVLTLLGVFILYAVNSFNPRLPGGDFELAGVNGPFRLQSQRGKAVVLYFGFTSCPDVCPISLHKLSQAMKSLTELERESIVPVFVSVDYRSDTPAKAQTYVQAFSQGGFGVTGTKVQIDRVTSLYGAAYMIEDTPKSALGYSVQHSTRFFLVDRKGRFRDSVPTETNNEELVKHLKETLK